MIVEQIGEFAVRGRFGGVSASFVTRGDPTPHGSGSAASRVVLGGGNGTPPTEAWRPGRKGSDQEVAETFYLRIHWPEGDWIMRPGLVCWMALSPASTSTSLSLVPLRRAMSS